MRKNAVKINRKGRAGKKDGGLKTMVDSKSYLRELVKFAE
jgi:hypothetical protein